MEADWKVTARKILGHLRLLPTARSARRLLRRQLRPSTQAIAELVETVNVLEASVTHADNRAAQADHNIAELAKIVSVIQASVADIDSRSAQQRNRLDWVLARTEGIIQEIEAFETARATEAYQAPFDKQNPLVSIVIATMDRAELLVERTLPSVIKQSFQNLQIVVVGDHCSDDTDKRLSSLGDDRIVFENLRERGPYPKPGMDRWYVAGANAMNHALSLCEGDFITHLDDDDRMVPDRIETMLAEAQRERAEFLWHPFWMEGSHGAWTIIGNGDLVCGQVTTGSIFYHRYFARIPWDLRAYRVEEPGDWNRIRRIATLRPRLHFVPKLLMYHHSEHMQGEFVCQPGERFLT